MLCVIIPVLNHIEWTDDCLQSIREGTVKPSEIILIDNGSTDPYSDLSRKYKDLNLLYIRNETNIDVNPAWNLGLSITKRRNVLFLNNDTLPNKYFIQKIYKVMQNPEVGICVPVREVTTTRVPLVNEPEENPEIKDCIYIDGWAFTMRKEIYDRVGPIPSSLKRYMGDSYFFECSKWLGYRNVQMVNNTVYHYGSGTIKDVCDAEAIRGVHRVENAEWRKMMDVVRKKLDGGEECIYHRMKS